MNALFRLLCSLCLLVLLNACSTPARPDLPPRPQRETVLNFSLEGRIAIYQTEHASTVRLSWDHAPETDSMAFAGPLGNRLAELQRNDKGARLDTSDGDHYEARNADQLLDRLIATPIPLDSLALWVLGRASAHAQVLQRDTSGRLLAAIDNGWVLHITAYESEQTNALPSTLEAEGNGLRVKLAIEAWQL